MFELSVVRAFRQGEQASNRMGALEDHDYSVTGDIQEEARCNNKEGFEHSGASQDSPFSEYLC